MSKLGPLLAWAFYLWVIGLALSPTKSLLLLLLTLFLTFAMAGVAILTSKKGEHA